jgi:hypothetical protein
MANELKTSRLTSSGAGSYVDNDMANMEATLRTIFGATADSDLSAVSSIGSGPDMTLLGTLTLAGAPTNDLHAATKVFVDGFSGTAATVRSAIKMNATQNITADTPTPLQWGAAEIESGGNSWDVGNPTRILFPVSGDYLVGGVVTAVDKIGGSAIGAGGGIYLNGSLWLYEKVTWGLSAYNADRLALSFQFMEPMSEGDYIEFYYLPHPTLDATVQAQSRIWTMKVGG